VGFQIHRNHACQRYAGAFTHIIANRKTLSLGIASSCYLKASAPRVVKNHDASHGGPNQAQLLRDYPARGVIGDEIKRLASLSTVTVPT
jgi:hypothetical protein